MKKLASERFGLIMIIAALVVIVLIAWLFLQHRQQSASEAVKMEGRNVVRLLANIPFEELVPTEGRSSVLELLKSSQRNTNFAYAAIVDVTGKRLAAVATDEVIIPDAVFSKEKNLWTTEHHFQSEAARSLFEFRAPVIDDGELVAYIRLGYIVPEFNLRELPFLGQLALPVFLLVPLMYALLRRELRPMRQAAAEVNSALHRQHIPCKSAEGEDFQSFMQNFKLFMQTIDHRFGELQQQNVKVKASTMALSYQRQRIESVLQSLPDALLVMDDSGKVTFANSKLAPLLGVSLDAVLDSRPHDWCDNTTVINLLAQYHSNVSRLQRSEMIEFVPRHNPDKTIAVSAYPLFTPKDAETICGTLVVFHDKTQEILAMQARDEFISHVAHELKSPLNVIHMYAELMLDAQGVSDEQRIDAVNVINDEVERLSLLIANLLNISKIEAGNIKLDRQRIKLKEFLEDTFNSVARNAAANDVQFDLQLPRNMSSIQVDKELLRIAINNLLTNAVKYNKSGGNVSLWAEETENLVLIHVSDTGVGVSSEDQLRIFDKFYRSSDQAIGQKQGHGLGLALAKEIVELHHGRISLKSTPGDGSEFTITLKKTATILKQAS